MNQEDLMEFFQEIIYLQKIKDGAYAINLDEYKDVGTHWIALFWKKNEMIYFDSFGVGHIPEEIKEFIGNKSINANIFRLQAYDSIIWDLLILCLKEKLWPNIQIFFSPYDFKKNDNIILSYFKDEW